MEEPTVNANPTVLAVEASSSSQSYGNVLHAWTQHPTNPTDQAVQQALRAAAAQSTTGGLSVLEHLGVKVLPTTASAEAPFCFSPRRWSPLAPETASNDKVEQKEDDDEQQQAQQQKDDLDADEVFDIIRNIQDPEHPLTLQQLSVVSRAQIVVTPAAANSGRRPRLRVRFTPTIPHCSMATQIGLCLRTKLDRSLPAGAFQTMVQIEPGTHASESAINKQLADKERVCAALENKHLLGVVNRCILNGMTGDMS